MSEAVPCKNLPILLGAIRQETGNGELVLEQSDAVRRISFLEGELISLRSEAAGEQFGGYLLRQGILDLPSLNRLLASGEPSPIGEKVISWGMMDLTARDGHLQCLQEQVMINALEHPILQWTWNAETADPVPSRGAPFRLQSRPFIWRTFREFNDPAELLRILHAESDWKWEGRADLLSSLADLPLTSSTAYALSFLGAEAIGFETFLFLSGLDEAEAGRFLATLWALGTLALACGKRPTVSTSRALCLAGQGLPFILPPSNTPFGPPKQRSQVAPIEMGELDLDGQPEFIDPDPAPGGPAAVARPSAIDLPPCGPRPPSWSVPRPDDLPPCGPRPQPLPPGGDGPPPQPRLDDSQAQFIDLDPERRGIPDPPKPQALLEARRLLERARRQARLGHTVEAVTTLEQAVRVLPDGDVAFDAWLMLGRLRMANLNWSARAIQALQNAARIRTREAEPWRAMGEIHRRTGSESDAVACFRKAQELDPAHQARGGGAD